MSSGEQPLMGPIHFPALHRAVERYKIINLVETGTGPSSSGMEAAKRLGLRGYSCDVYAPCVMRASELYPEFRIELCNSLDFLKAVLPTLSGPTFFWLDGHCPTDPSCIPGGVFPLYEEMLLVRQLKSRYERDVIWIDDIPMIMDPENPYAWKSAEGLLAGKPWFGERDHTWAQYCDVFKKTHQTDIVDLVMRLTPKDHAQN